MADLMPFQGLDSALLLFFVFFHFFLNDMFMIAVGFSKAPQ